ncbi:hypothetical protein D3C77_441150 [compost metagenome]
MLLALFMQFLMRDLLQQLTSMDDAILRCHLMQLAQDMTGNQNRYSRLAIQLLDQLSQFNDTLGVKSVRRFVENEQFRVA